MTSSLSSSEGSSSPELELGLGLGLFSNNTNTNSNININTNTRGAFKEHVQVKQYARILTAQDLPSLLLSSSSSSSSFSSSSSSSSSTTTTTTSCSTLSHVNGSFGSKRTADSVAAPSQVVGWPPIGACRMNSMVNQAKSVATQEYNSRFEKAECKNPVEDKTTKGFNIKNANCNSRTSFFVKVYMDRMPIGRKIDLSTQGCYETLAQTLEEMFLGPTPSNGKRISSQENMMRDSTRQPKLLDGSSEFVLIYEDKDGDWMLVGDVPWGMFIASVKRLKIMRASEATGLGKLI